MLVSNLFNVGQQVRIVHVGNGLGDRLGWIELAHAARVTGCHRFVMRSFIFFND